MANPTHEQLRFLARQSGQLMQSLYDQSMTAAMHGEPELSERLYRLSQRALQRHKRRFDALRRSVPGTP